MAAEAPELGWGRARLIPATGIRGTEEQETRATAALLAVMHGVPDFGSSLLRLAGGPRGTRKVDTFTEIRLQGAEGQSLRPDGAAVIRVPRVGRMSWLIEVKTGRSNLEPDQLDAYLDLARDGGFDAVLTVSNQITSSPTESPVVIPARRGRPRPPHYHLSWWRVLAEAVVHHQHRGVSDPDQAWILGELIEYLDDERSGVLPLRDMGPSWVQVREAAREQRLQAGDAGVADVAERWEQLVEYLCLGLYRDLGRFVEATSNRGEPTTRRQEACRRLADEGKLLATIKITDAAAPIQVETDLRGRMLYASLELGAPQDRQRAVSRVRWLLAQLRSVPPERNLQIEALYPRGGRTTTSLVQAREQPEALLLATDPRRPARAFRVIGAREMVGQAGRRQADGGFIETTRRHVADFYREVVQGVTPWRPRPAKLPDAEPAEGPEAVEPQGGEETQ